MKTRAFYISLLTVLLSFTSIKAQLGSHIGFNVGPSISVFHGSDYAENFRSKTGLAAGITYQYAFNTTFALHTGLMYESKGVTSRMTLDPFDIDVRTRSNFSYLAAPVLFRAHLLPEKKLRPFINAGPYFGFLMRQMNVTRSDNNGNIDVERENNTDSFNAFDIGLSGGVGLDFLITSNMHLDFEVRNNLGFYNISESDNSDFRLKNNSLNFMVGMLFSIH